MITLNTTGKVISKKMRVGRGIGSGKGKTSGKTTEMEDRASLYFGREGDVVCVMAYGEHVKRIEPLLLESTGDVLALQPVVGQPGRSIGRNVVGL